jgi:hypothetical protein
MRYFNLATVALLSLTALPAMAQAPAGTNPATGARPGHEPGVGVSLPLSNKASNINQGERQAAVAPTLPRSGLGVNETPGDYLRAARSALVAGRTGQAQQSLEMAETRALDRSVPQGEANTPSGSPLVARIRDALHALGDRDNRQAIGFIDQALAII